MCALCDGSKTPISAGAGPKCDGLEVQAVFALRILRGFPRLWPRVGTDVSVTGRTVPSNWRVRRTAMLIIYNIISSDDHVAAITTIRKPARPLTASR
jgi:hypothetical protein